MSKEFDISERFKRIYAGINKWKAIGYKGVFQYTARMNIPTVIESVCQHIEVSSEDTPYVMCVVPDIKTKDSIRVKNISFLKIATFVEFCEYIADKCKGKNKLICDTFIILDITNPCYYTGNALFLKMKKVEAKRFLGITSKVIKPDVADALNKSGIPIIDVITKADALENGWISPHVIYNIGIQFTDEEKKVYQRLSETISGTYQLFKGKAAMVNSQFKRLTHLKIDLVEDDFALILACSKGVNYCNDLTEKTEHIHSETVRGMVAEIMGWRSDLDASVNDRNKQVIMYWHPDNILSRSVGFKEAVDKRLSLYTNNDKKRKILIDIINAAKGQVLILNENSEISNFVETLPNCTTWYKGISSRCLKDANGEFITYKVGAKKGEPKVFGEAGIRKYVVEKFSANLVKAVATYKIANDCFDIPNVSTIICTSPYSNPFQTITDTKMMQPYINKVSNIIWLYMQDFTVSDEVYTLSKDKEKLLQVQDRLNIDIIWCDSVNDIKF